MSVDIVFPAPALGKKKADIGSIAYGDQLIEYVVKERKSDINRLLIKVHPDCHVVVLAPKGISNIDISIAVKKRSRWIYTQLNKFKSQLEHVAPRSYIGGESHYYLGKQYLLKVTKAEEEARVKSKVKLLRGKLEVSVCSNGNARQIVKESLSHWYKDRAKEVFARRLEAAVEKTPWVLERPQIRIITMKKQWGSCSPGGRLTLNTNLVKAPRECIDYVILHELCHIAEHNHSKRFYRLMSEVMPHWEEVKERLDGMADIMLNGSV